MLSTVRYIRCITSSRTALAMVGNCSKKGACSVNSWKIGWGRDGVGSRQICTDPSSRISTVAVDLSFLLEKRKTCTSPSSIKSSSIIGLL